MDVLVVEDEAPLRESLVEGLADAFADLVVEGAASAEEAEPRLTGASPRLIVTDVRLPGKDGAEFLLGVREKLPNTRFIFMSAYPSPEAQEHARVNDIQFLRKPFEFSDLLGTAERLLEQRDFSGELGGISLVDLLQVLNLGRRTAAVSLQRRDQVGRIFLADGEVVHAVAGDLKGRRAFDHLMGWQGGSFGSESGCEPPERTIDESFNGLLLDCFRAQDEGGDDVASDEFDASFLDFDDEGDAPLPSAEGLQQQIESARQMIPGCVGSGCVDIENDVLLCLTPPDDAGESATKTLPQAIAGLFRSDALSELDSKLSAVARGKSPARSAIGEVIALSDQWIHHFQAVGNESNSVLIAVSENRRSLGTVVSRARQWKKSCTECDGGA